MSSVIIMINDCFDFVVIPSFRHQSHSLVSAHQGGWSVGMRPV